MSQRMKEKSAKIKCTSIADNYKQWEQDIWKEFHTSTTLHGFNKIFAGRFLGVRSIIWLFSLSSCFAYLGFTVLKSLHKYQRHEIVSSISTRYPPSITWPEIYVCVRNPLLISRIKKSRYFITYAKNRGLNTSDVTISDIMEFVGGMNKMSYDAKVAFENEASYSRYDLIKICELASKSIDCRVLLKHRYYISEDPYAFCFHLSLPENNKVFTREKFGLSNGLFVIMKLPDQDDWLPSLSRGQSIDVAVLRKGEVKFSGQSFAVPAGFMALCSLEVTKTELLPPPFPSSHCSNFQLRYFQQYSIDGCIEECHINNTMSTCNCSDALYSYGLAQACGTVKSQCLDKNALSKCFNQCKETCTGAEYKCSLTFRHFLELSSSDPAFLRFHDLSHLIHRGTRQENFQYIRSHYVGLQIAMQEVSYRLIKEIKAYDLSDLLGDLGGQMGLFLGASILTWFEFMDLATCILWQRVTFLIDRAKRISSTKAPISFTEVLTNNT